MIRVYTYAHRFTNTRPYTFLNISQIFFTVILFKAVSGIQVLRLFCPYYCSVASVVSDSVRPHRRQLTRFPCSWDSPGKNTGVGCHFLLDGWKWKVKGKSLSHVRLFTTHWWQPTSLHRPWDFPGKSTAVGCHCLLQLSQQGSPITTR